VNDDEPKSFTPSVNKLVQDSPDVDILFSTDKMRKLFTTRSKLVGEYGAEQAARIARRLDDLRTARNLETMRTLPGRCHELTGDLDGTLSLDLKHPFRLLFKPVGDHVRREDGGLDWAKVETVLITGVEDTHG
jgi:proteic killer suppression protein